MNILIINGVNLNMLGIREKDKYGTMTLEEMNKSLLEYANQRGIAIDFSQSNYEGGIVETIHKSTNYDGIIINPAAFTHTSIAIRDAFLSVKVPFVEVHMTNIFSREQFRHISYLSDIAIGVICGFGKNSYNLAIDYFANCNEKK